MHKLDDVPLSVSFRKLDDVPLFSLTLWRSADGFTAAFQAQAGDCPRYETRKTASAAVEAVLPKKLPGLPY